MKKWLVRISILAVLGAGMYGLSRTVFAPEPIPVEVTEVARGRVESTVTNSKAGTVKARQRARISPEMGGRVVEVLCEVGARVKKGDVLARLDDAAQKAQLLHAERSLTALHAIHQQACIASERSRGELQRNQSLASKGHISDDLLESLTLSLEANEAACAAAGADVERAKASIDVATVALGKTVVRAPFDGIVAAKNLELGEWVTPSPPMVPVPAILDIINPSSIYISAPMDEVDSAVIKVGQVTRVTLDPYPGREFEGRVVRIAPFVLDLEAQNRTVEVEVELVDRQFATSLLPGTSSDVEILLEVREDVLRLPSSCVLEGSRVLVVEGEVLFEKEISIGLKNWAYTEITKGVEPGTRVVTSLDRLEVKAGAQVEVASVDSDGEPGEELP